jgi:hypothetical protein
MIWTSTPSRKSRANTQPMVASVRSSESMMQYAAREEKHHELTEVLNPPAPAATYGKLRKRSS